MNNAIVATTDKDGQLSSGEYLPIFQSYMAGNQRRAKESKVSVYQTPDEVAAVILEVALSEQPKSYRF